MNCKLKKASIFLTLCWLYILMEQCSSEQRIYFNLEHPMVMFYNTTYLSDFSIKSNRINRNDPVHYITMNITTRLPIEKEVRIDIYVYEMRANVYRTTYLELHFNMCYILERDPIIGHAIRTSYLRTSSNKLTCPVAPGNFVFPDFYIPLNGVVLNFAIPEGRLYCNITRLHDLIWQGYIHFQKQTYKTVKKTIV